MKKRKKIKAISVFSSKGIRPVQEDHVVVDRDRGVFAVADGFGGPESGFEAAKIACESVSEFLSSEAGDRDATLPFEMRSYFSLAGNILFNSVIYANEKVNALNDGRHSSQRGGASLLAGFLDGDLMAIANNGVCSAWLFRGEKFERLVIPKTLFRLSKLSKKGGAQSGVDVPLTALGMTKDLEPEISELQVEEGDWVLFHTDGLSERRLDDFLALKLMGFSESEAADRLNTLLEEIRFGDNISLSLVFL